MRALLCAIFFASGAAALVFETLWFRQAGLAFGNSVWASSLVLAGFMAGLGLGNALAARYGDRLANPLRAYALAEVAIALTGVGLVFLLPILGAALVPWIGPLVGQPWLLNPARLLVAFLLLLVPSTAMGVTLPLLTKTLIVYDPRFGPVLGRLYGWNTLGAVTGVVTAEAFFIGALGVRGTAIAAGAAILLIAALSAWLSTRTAYVPAAAPPAAPRWAAGRTWLTVVFLSGFALLALEVVWFRFLLLFASSSPATFALMLAVVLAGIALGGLTASIWLRHQPHAYGFAATIAFAAGVFCVASYAAFPFVIQSIATNALSRLDLLRVGLPLMFPVAFLSGIFFTLIGAALRGSLGSESETTGALTFANTAGAAIGSLAGGFLLLPLLGMERSFFLLALLYGGIGVLLALRKPSPRWIPTAAAGVLLVTLLVFPFGSMENRLLRIPAQRWSAEAFPFTTEIAAVREGLTETIIYLQVSTFGEPAYHTMLTNSIAMSGTSFFMRRYQQLYVYWPMAVHPNLKRALLIAYGAGNTAKAMTDSRSLESIDVVDLSRDILETNAIIYPRESGSPLDDPRVTVHIEDGRYFLQTTDRRFDLITGEPPPPGMAGVENLYSREYFRLLYDRLAEGGIVTYWLPFHSLTDASTRAILRAFCDVFADCSLWNGAARNLMMVGSRNARGPVSEAAFVRQWEDPVVAAEMTRVGLERPEQLGALFIGDADYLNDLIGDVPPLVDDHPKRIEAPFGSTEATERLLRAFLDTGGARERFENSALIRRLWPERMVIAALPFFEIQEVINTVLYQELVWGPVRVAPPGRDWTMELTHRVLSRSPVSAPVLWLWGSNADILDVIAGATRDERAQLPMQFDLGVWLLSEREYAAAVEPLGRAEQLEEFYWDAFILRVYALCLAGQLHQAQRLAEERFGAMVRQQGVPASALTDASLPPDWLWLKRTFGIDPFAGVLGE